MIYEPELGQAVYGKSWFEFEINDNELEALRLIQEKYFTNWQKDPFGNTGAKCDGDCFKIEAYSWDENYDQPYNFSWKDWRVKWYKWLGRGTTCNRHITEGEILDMLSDISFEFAFKKKIKKRKQKRK